MTENPTLEKMVVREREKEIKDAEDRLERIKTILGSVQNGWSVALYRRAPGWAEGHLETKRILDDSEAIDLDYIAQQWGGEVIQVRIQDEHGKYVQATDIPFRSYPPKTWGRELTHPNYRHLEQDQKTEKPVTQDPLSTVNGLLGIIERLKSNEPKQQNNLDMKIIELLLRNQMQPAAPAQNPLDAIQQAMQMIGMVKELGGLLGNNAPPADDDMIGKLGGIVDLVLKAKNAQPPPQVPRIAPPAQRNPQIPPGEPPKPMMEGPVHPIDQLANMEPERAAEAVLLALDRMPEDRRARALAVFFQHLGIEEDEEPFDESPEVVQNLHYGASEDVQNPHTRGRPGPNAGNDPPDR